jgi:DNA-directed RNA polymerase subunit RPC12/RpoP
MPEIESEVKTIQVDYICDECGDGFMIFTGSQGMSNPPYNYHRCDKCGFEIGFYGVIYPGIRHIKL